MSFIDNIKYVGYQRNGVQGEPFYYIFFECTEDGLKEDLIAVVTDRSGGCYIVNPSNPDKHYRGDNHEADMREAIISWYMKTYGVDRLRAAKELNDGLKEPVYGIY